MPRVLLADDDPVSRLLASEALAHAGFEVVEAEDGEQAVARFRQQRCDAVLLDVMMPGLDGYQACATLRRLPAGAVVPIVLITSLDDPESIDRAYESGATDFITKPLNATLLHHRLRYLLRSARTFVSLQHSAWRLSQAHRLAKLAQWELCLRTDRMTWSDEVEGVLGRVPGSRSDDYLDLVHVEDRREVQHALLSNRDHELEYRVVLDDGTERIVHHEAELSFDQVTGREWMIGAIQDVTERRMAERRVTELAYYDSLTGLPNRAYLHRYLTDALSDAERYGQRLAVLALDLDMFKRVNDVFGHAVGDTLLTEVARRLTTCTRAGDTIVRSGSLRSLVPESETLAARLGGDEFIVVLRRLRTPEEAGIVARRILDSLAQSYDLQKTTMFVSTSIGIATYPDNGADPEVLLDHADSALYSAKDQGRNTFQFYNEAIQVRARRRAEIEQGLRGAMARTGVSLDPRISQNRSGPPELSLQYQPKVRFPSGELAGFEALLRWTSPTLGAVSPAEFVPAAEDAGLIVALGDWVLTEACHTAAAWPDVDGRPQRVAVNISVRQFSDPAFEDRVARALATSGLAPDRLELEITESVVMDDTTTSARVIDGLKALGVKVALDDFGTGYSSLSYLTRFRIDILKIDRSFVVALDSVTSQAIVAAIMALSRSLGLEVVAEGVENAEQLALLQQHGELSVQGFYVGRPMPAESWPAWETGRHVDGSRSEGG